jgi:outer membrane protein TolC
VIRCSWIAALAVLVSTATPGTAGSPDPAVPLLSLEEAVELALGGNHLLAGTALTIDEAEDRTAALRTRRLPVLGLAASEGGWLNDLDLTIPAGSLGDVPPLGTFPSQDTTLSVPDDQGGVATVSVSQPLTQQYKIGLGLKITGFDRQIAEEDLRRERQRIIAEVRSTYYQISATEQGIVALRDTVRAVEELDAVTARYLQEGLVLRSDALEVQARLALERQRLAAAVNRLATQQERFNQLLGRDLLTPFRVATPSELAPPAARLTLEEARERARASRAEIRSATLITARADTARRLAVAGWVPDVSLTASYTRLTDFETLPDDVTTVGLFLNWEPFDWGRKRHEAAERTHQTQRAREGREETEQQIAVEVGQRWRALKDAAVLLEAMRLEQDATAASLETDRNRYRESAAILRDVLRTEARLSSARRDFIDVLSDYWSAVATLERAIGDER